MAGLATEQMSAVTLGKTAMVKAKSKASAALCPRSAHSTSRMRTAEGVALHASKAPSYSPTNMAATPRMPVWRQPQHVAHAWLPGVAP